MNKAQELSQEIFSLTHIREFKDLIGDLQAKASEYCFSNLYLFRNQHDYRVFRKEGYTFLLGVTYDGVHYAMPFNPIRSIETGVLDDIMKSGFCLFPIVKEDLVFFPENKYKNTFNGDDSDYIYTIDKIRNYPGRKLHKKRNLVKQYRELYEYQDKEYVCEDKDDAMQVLDTWFKNTGLPVEDTDYLSCKESIEKCLIFGLKGQVYYTAGGPTGILFGEELNSDTFVIHFAKGNTAFKGIYAHMYSSLANALDDKYLFLNFEQDMGKENLRQAKSTYLQDDMLDKYRVSLL